MFIMNELREKKERLCEDIANMINGFLEDEKLEFSSLSYDTDWSGESPRIQKIKLKVAV